MSKNTLRGIIALILVALIGFGIFIGWGIGSNWGEIKDIKDYFNGWGQNKPDEEQPLPDDEQPLPDDVQSLQITVEEDTGSLMLLSLAEQSSTQGNIITAKVKDENGLYPANLQHVEWSLSWYDEDTSGDPNDCIQMEISSDGLSVELKLERPSGLIAYLNHPAVIICTSTVNPEIKASAKIDSYTRNYTLYAGSVQNKQKFYELDARGGLSSDIHIDFEGVTETKLMFFVDGLYSNGTIDDEVTSGSFEFALTEQSKLILENNISGFSGVNFKTASIDGSIATLKAENTLSDLILLCGSSMGSTIGQIMGSFSSLDFSLFSGVPFFELNFELTCKSGKVITGDYNILFSYTSSASDVELDNSSVIL